MITFRASFNNSYLFAGLSWNRDANGNPIFDASVALSYSYLSELPAYYLPGQDQGDPQMFSPVHGSTFALLDAARLAWSAVANIEWIQPQSAVGAITFGFYDLGGTAGVAYMPDPVNSEQQGDVWLNSAFNTSAALTVGGEAYSTLLHEIGHALGLDHASAPIAYPSQAAPVPAAEDSVLYSTMSYNFYNGKLNVTPMVHDIVTIQRIYGANTSFNSGDTTYEFGVNTHPFNAITEGIYDRPDQVLMTLWDGGGNDTIDATFVVAPVFIDLEPGAYSAIGTLTGSPTEIPTAEIEAGLNVGIAYGAHIENAKGGSGSDQILGTSLNNQLFGNDGADQLWGLAGNDILFGGAESDELIGGIGSDYLYGGDGYDAYIYEIGDGIDVIGDSDRSGRVVFNSVVLDGGKLTSDSGTYTSRDGKHTYSWTGDDLLINGLLTVEGFHNGDLGIYLDPKEDSDENEYRDPFEQGRGNLSPIILDLNGDGVQTTAITAGAYFDHDRNGLSERTGWASAQDGILVRDRNGDGRINNGNELFGNSTLLTSGQPAANGFQALAELDANADGKIDASDSVWSELAIWKDLDGNGYSSSEELYSLSAVGVQSIQTSYSTSTYVDPQGNAHKQIGAFTRTDQTTGAAEDIWFATDSLFSITESPLSVPIDVAVLPNVQGSGLVHSLHQAMALDPTAILKGLVETFVSQTSVADRETTLQALLYRWAGVDGVAPDARGHAIDARKVALLEKFVGDTWEFINEAPGSNGRIYHRPAWNLEIAHRALFEQKYAALMSETHLKDYFDVLTYQWDQPSQTMRVDLQAAKNALAALEVTDPAAAAIAKSEFMRAVAALFDVDQIVGMAALNGTVGSDNITVNAPAALVNAGADTTVVGNDSITVSTDLSSVYITTGGGGDTITVSGAYAHVTVEAGAGNDILQGGSGPDVLHGGLWGGNDTIYGGAGNDVLDGHEGEDFLSGGEGDDFIYGGSANDQIFGGSGDDHIWGGDSHPYVGSDVLHGEDGNDTIRGGSEQDTIYGGAGDDLISDNGGTNWIDAGDGNDRITLNAQFDSIDTVFGGAGDDVITVIHDNANGGGIVPVHTLNGGPGTDLIIGGRYSNIMVFNRGDGADTFYSAHGASKVRFGPGIGLAHLSGRRFGAAGENWEIFVADPGNPTADDRLAITYTAGGVTGELADGTQLTHNDLFNIVSTILGTPGNDVLQAAYGSQILKGLAGDDTYILSGLNETIVENLGEGTDHVISPFSVVLAANFENATLLGGAANSASGNSLDNILIGNSGNNSLNGFQGADSMSGAAGDDTYTVDNVNDVVMENAGEGNDTVQSSVSYALAGNVESLVLLGGALNATGNSLNNTISGNSLDNVINGGAGADTMTGGAGNDTYLVDNLGDLVIENPGQGTDTVESSVTHALAADIENLVLLGAAAIDGTGNALSNVLTGNSGDNVLDGGNGIDTMTGGLGNDTYVMDSPSDVVTENAGEGSDTIKISWTYTLGANFENLTLIGGSPVNGTGNANANILTGNSANNVLDGAGGADTMAGGGGNDTYIVDHIDDVVTEQADEGIDVVQASYSYALSANVEDLTLTGVSAINGTGNGLANVLLGNGANNVLDAGAGADRMIGRAGDDTYVVDDPGDLVSENPGEGTDTAQAFISYTLTLHVENLTLIGISAINGTGNDLGNILIGNGADNVLNGGPGGTDTLLGGLGNDTYVVADSSDIVVENAGEGIDTVQSSSTYTLPANVENLTLVGSVFVAINGTGNSLDNVIIGHGYSNTLTGGGGNDTLDGGGWSDTLIGGPGDDIYIVDNTSDVVTENPGEGTDTVRTSVANYALSADVENLTLLEGGIYGTGNGLANILTGNSADNVLNGYAGADTLIGGAGNDTYKLADFGVVIIENPSEGTDLVEAARDYTLAANIENLTLIGVGLNGTGNDLPNIIVGTPGNDVINGGGGADTLSGGVGDDTYVLDNVGDVVTENTDGGTDTVQTSLSYALGANLENLTLVGIAAIDGTGNDGANVLIGNGADNVLDGGAGSDSMAGGAGNDTYIVESSGDVVTELAAEGVDTVRSSLTLTLGANVENLTLVGVSAINGTGNGLNNVLVGNAGNNTLTGGDGHDTLDGGTGGTDTLVGGLGNDTYIISSSGDTVTEASNAGTDTVQSAITYTLGSNVENLTLIDGAAINGTGNTLNNVIIGNSANNTLSGGSGNDTLDGGGGSDAMSGGQGNDIYVVAEAGDTVTESNNQGTDVVQSYITYTLTLNVEQLALLGNADINGTGNTLANTLTGNAGNNVLDGGAGADTMSGGAGNDTYVIDNTSDVVNENANEGTDTVQSAVTRTLGANQENLTLTGTTAINGTGNTLDNTLIGNTANNTLTGGAGNDWLDGGSGNDTMVGGVGNDTFAVDAAADVVTENANEGTDTVRSAIAYTLGTNVENLVLLGEAALNGTGNTLNNLLAGNSGNNTLTGNAGNDTLDGAAGSDTLVGGTGNDTYIVGRGYGGEIVQENDATAGNADVGQFLSGVATDQIWFQQSGNNLMVSIIGTADQMTIQSWYSGSQFRVEQFKTTDGNKTLVEWQVQNLVDAMAAFSPPAMGQMTLPQNYADALNPVIAANWQ